MPKWLRPAKDAAPVTGQPYAAAVALYSNGQLPAARTACLNILATQPEHADVLSLLGIIESRLGHTTDAIALFKRALRIHPHHARLLNNLGNAYLSMGQYQDALPYVEQALACQPDLYDAQFNRANLLRSLERRAEALAAYSQLWAEHPQESQLINGLLELKMMACDWQGQPELEAAAVQAIQRGASLGKPFVNLNNSRLDAQLQWQAASQEYRQNFAKVAPVWQGQIYRHEKLRVAYLSADFHNHATAHLMADLFEQHDRQQFEWTALSYGPDDQSPMRQRLLKAFDRFVDVRELSERQIATWLLEHEIDIAVDLKGYTGANRLGILVHRGAPIQVTHIGYPGTLGADCIDYVIGDRWVTPPEHQDDFTERIIRLPDSYQCNDRQRPLPPAASRGMGADERREARQQAGLPPDAFVFCCFNNTYKIHKPVFDIWLRLLGQTPHAVLWLLGDSDAAVASLKQAAQAQGIDAGRLIFAPRTNNTDYLARYQLADLFLDTLPYNAHTTASDALWIGVPVLTCLGQTFAGRVAASLLSAVELPEMITRDAASYEKLALELTRQPERLQNMARHLREKRLSLPLFDTPRFARNIEAAYQAMAQRHRAGLPPAPMDIGL